MGRLSTHVLDTAKGKPAAGVAISLYRLQGEARELLLTTRTNDDGRTDQPLLLGDALLAGSYELVFHAGDYLRASGQAAGDVLFLDQIPIRFGLSEDAHYHVPLLLSAYGYSTYRGS